MYIHAGSWPLGVCVRKGGMLLRQGGRDVEESPTLLSQAEIHDGTAEPPAIHKYPMTAEGQSLLSPPSLAAIPETPFLISTWLCVMRPPSRRPGVHLVHKLLRHTGAAWLEHNMCL